MKHLLYISEIFHSIQGEGRFLGTPSIFIRSSGCNLRCRWGKTLCDTPYTSWDTSGENLSLDTIMNTVHVLKKQAPRTRHIVLTGGEPTLQFNLESLASRLSEQGFFITLESNGSIVKSMPIDFVSLSPKLKSSTPFGSKYETMHRETRLQKKTLQYWISHYDYQLKFVIDNDEDEDEILAFIDTLPDIDQEKIYLMPQGINTETLRRNAKRCIAICLRHGWCFTPRAHIDIFGNQRGK